MSSRKVIQSAKPADPHQEPQVTQTVYLTPRRKGAGNASFIAYCQECGILTKTQDNWGKGMKPFRKHCAPSAPDRRCLEKDEYEEKYHSDWDGGAMNFYSMWKKK